MKTKQRRARHNMSTDERIKHLVGLSRPLTDDEQAELYRALHANYMREWRAARIEREANAETLEKDRQENTQTLARVQREARKYKPNDEWMNDAREGSARLLDAIQRLAA